MTPGPVVAVARIAIAGGLSRERRTSTVDQQSVLGHIGLEGWRRAVVEAPVVRIAKA